MWNANFDFCCNALGHCCHANKPLFWHLVYINCPDHEAERSATSERGHTCPRLHPSASSLQHPVRPPDGLDRPPSDREQPHRHPQRRPPLFWALSANFAASRVRICAPHSQDSTMAPGFRGHFIARAGCRDCRHLRQIGHVDNRKKTICTVAYHIQEYVKRSYQQSRAHQGDGHVQSARDSERDVAEDGQCAHASAFSCASQSTIGQKERMPRRLAPRTIPACNGRDEATIAA